MAEKTPDSSTDIVTTPGKDEQALSTRETERYISPPVDIYETKDGLVVMADLPGVGKDGVDVRVEDGVLTIKGKSEYDAPADAVRSEFRLVNYFRQFELTDEVDQNKIGAELKNGVLSVNLPKAEKAKPKKVTVKIS